jgi:trehalose 6-phosphate phosphatase
MVPAIANDDAVFLDFDGTLVAIADTPASVTVDARIPHILTRVAARLDGAVAVISGRSLKDLETMLWPYQGAAAGIHGLERRTVDGTIIRPASDPDIERVRSSLECVDQRALGILVEDKGLAFAIHYRSRPERAVICLAFASKAVEISEHRLATLCGKMVVEILPRDADKGNAILSFLEEPPFAGRRPIFVGDDHTDEKGFSTVNRLNGVSIHVGGRNSTSALYRLPDVSAVVTWLANAGSPPAQSASGSLVDP